MTDMWSIRSSEASFVHGFQIFTKDLPCRRLGNIFYKLDPPSELFVCGDLLLHVLVDSLLSQALLSPHDVGPGRLSLPLILHPDHRHVHDARQAPQHVLQLGRGDLQEDSE